MEASLEHPDEEDSFMRSWDSMHRMPKCPATWCVECFSDLTATTSIDIWWMQSQKFQENWFAFSINSFYSQHHKNLCWECWDALAKWVYIPSTLARAGWRWGRSCSASASCSSHRWPWGPASTAGPRARSCTPSSSQPGHKKYSEWC